MRKLVSSESPFEPRIGFSRAVRVGQLVAVSGTAPIAADGSVACPGDVYGQTRRCLEIIADVVVDAGLSFEAISALPLDADSTNPVYADNPIDLLRALIGVANVGTSP